jgi:NTP pyrophosphatase (non-canonical NTP hydrolase)
MGYPSEETFRRAHSSDIGAGEHVCGRVYRNEVRRTSPDFNLHTEWTKLSLGALGLAGETGEVVDLIKKFLHHGAPLDKSKLIQELGDVRWYLEYLAMILETDMATIEAVNVAKLRGRYPDGFSFEAANAKRDL